MDSVLPAGPGASSNAQRRDYRISARAQTICGQRANVAAERAAHEHRSLTLRRDDQAAGAPGLGEDARMPRVPSPPASSPAARATMQANRRRDTAPELALRRELHRRGLRYRVDHAPVPGLRCRADVVFTRARVAVFVDGCFWHRCPDHGNTPRANHQWWDSKLAANVERDRAADAALRARGWSVIRIWEHEPPEDAAERIERLVGRSASPRAGFERGGDHDA